MSAADWLFLSFFALCIMVLVALLVPHTRGANQEKARLAQEARLAEWRVQAMAYEAFKHLLDEARRSRADQL